jgi:hypothetical protein
MAVVLIIVAFTVQWLISYGLAHAHFKYEYPSCYDARTERGACMMITLPYAILPVLGPIFIFLLSGFAKHGFEL